MFFLIISLSRADNQCSITYQPDLGAHFIRQEITPNDHFCINFSYYPLFVSFYSIPNSVTYHEYYSRSPERKVPHDYSAKGSNLPAFRSFELPYGSFEFTTTSDAIVQFTTISFPGCCLTGIYISNYQKDSIEITTQGTNFTKFQNYDDKCIIFASPSQQNIHMEFAADDNLDQFFVYYNYSNYSVYNGVNYRHDFILETKDSPPLFRILTKRSTPPYRLLIQKTSEEKPLIQLNGFFIPRHKIIDCEKEITWYTKNMIYTLIVIGAFFFLIIVLLIVYHFMSKR